MVAGKLKILQYKKSVRTFSVEGILPERIYTYTSLCKYFKLMLYFGRVIYVRQQKFYSLRKYTNKRKLVK